MTLQPSLPERWDAFLDAFHQSPNELTADIEPLQRYIARGRVAVGSNPPMPLIMPAKVGGTTNYFAVAFDVHQARSLRELLRSHIGTTWTDFDGRSLSLGDLDPLEQAALALAGERSRVFRFAVYDHPYARNQVRGAVEALSVSLVAGESREARIATPLGRLLGNLADACAAGAEQAAIEAFDRVAHDHRISAVNKLFQRVQLLAAFERWEEIEGRPEFVDLLRMPRPALASDALARVAMSKISQSATPDAAGQVATQFGALIPSVSAIRSESGAHYYALWALRSGEPVAQVRDRLASAGWPSDEFIDRFSGPAAGTDWHGAAQDISAGEARGEVQVCIETGRFDSAVDLLAGISLTVEDLPAAIEAIVNTWTPDAVSLLERCRAQFGEQALRDAAPRAHLPSNGDLGLSVTGHLAAIFHRGTAPADRMRHLQAIESAGVGALRVDGAAAAVADTIRQTTGLPDNEVEPEAGLDICLDLARDLKASGATRSGSRALGLAVMESWALRDRSGDRDRARRIAQLVSDVLDLGVSVDAFDELVEWLRVGWEPFSIENDLPMSLELLELLLPYRPQRSPGLEVFGRQILSRIGPHNVRRISPAVVAVAVSLAPMFDMELHLPADEIAPTPAVRALPFTILLYSLLTPVLERSATILGERHPELKILTCYDEVATDALRSASKSADLIVIMDRAATHSATDALRTFKDVQLRYAAGKGSSSMIDAVETWLAEQYRDSTE